MDGAERDHPWHVVTALDGTFTSGHLSEREAHLRADEANLAAEQAGIKTRYKVVPRNAPTIPLGWANLGP